MNELKEKIKQLKTIRYGENGVWISLEEVLNLIDSLSKKVEYGEN